MELLIYVAIIIGVILMTRAFGAWMLRINEIIDLQKGILSEISKLRKDIQRSKNS